MKKIVVFTGSRLRHKFFRKALALASGLQVLRTFCEPAPGSERSPGAEEDLFGALAVLAPDISEPKNGIDPATIEDELRKLRPDLLVVFECASFPPFLLESYKKKVVTLELPGDRAVFREPQPGGKAPKPLHELRPRLREGESEDEPLVQARLLVDASRESAEVLRKLEDYRERVGKH